MVHQEVSEDLELHNNWRNSVSPSMRRLIEWFNENNTHIFETWNNDSTIVNGLYFFVKGKIIHNTISNFIDIKYVSHGVTQWEKSFLLFSINNKIYLEGTDICFDIDNNNLIITSAVDDETIFTLKDNHLNCSLYDWENCVKEHALSLEDKSLQRYASEFGLITEPAKQLIQIDYDNTTISIDHCGEIKCSVNHTANNYHATSTAICIAGVTMPVIHQNHEHIDELLLYKNLRTSTVAKSKVLLSIRDKMSTKMMHLIPLLSEANYSKKPRLTLVSNIGELYTYDKYSCILIFHSDTTNIAVDNDHIEKCVQLGWKDMGWGLQHDNVNSDALGIIMTDKNKHIVKNKEFYVEDDIIMDMYRAKQNHEVFVVRSKNGYDLGQVKYIQLYSEEGIIHHNVRLFDSLVKLSIASELRNGIEFKKNPIPILKKNNAKVVCFRYIGARDAVSVIYEHQNKYEMITYNGAQYQLQSHVEYLPDTKEFVVSDIPDQEL